MPSRNNRRRVLLTGVSGLLGNNLAYCFRDLYNILGVYHSVPVTIAGVRTTVADLVDKTSLRRLVREFRPDVVIHCAALTDVEFCEKNEQLAETVNVQGTRALIECLDGTSAQFVFISTDLVYDSKEGICNELDPVNPPNCYAVSKYKAEQEAEKHVGSLILRTNIFGWNIQKKFSLAEWIIHELSNRRRIQGFKDVIFSTIYTFHFAEFLNKAIERGLSGVYNLGSSTSMSKFEFAVHIARRFGLDESLIHPISVDNFDFRARRNKNLALDTSKLARDLDKRLPTLDESIEAFSRDHMQGISAHIKDQQPKPIYPIIAAIPYGRQSLDDDDIESVVEVLKSPNLTQGPKITEFEGELCALTGARYAVVVNSGTAALHIACLAAGIAPGEEVITSPNTFVASANCIVYSGAVPIFADIHPQTYNISPQNVECKITQKTRGVIPVHFAGQSAEMEDIKRTISGAERYYDHRIYLIEDASHALGSQYKGQQVGACTYSDMAVMSFHPVKHITTGEGGAILTNDAQLYKRLRLFRNHGITNDSTEFVQHESNAAPPWYYEQIVLGYNYRITDISCALGISQLRKLSAFMARRREIVDMYNTCFKDLQGVSIPYEMAECKSNFHLYVLQFDFEYLGLDRVTLINKLRQRGVYTQVHYIPVHTQPYYQRMFQTKWGDCPVAESYYQKCLSLPLYPAMTVANTQRVVESVCDIIRSYE